MLFRSGHGDDEEGEHLSAVVLRVVAVVGDEGQVQIGSKGPLELNGGQINANGPLRVSTYPTTLRPSATSLDAGTMIFDTTLKKPIWSDGSTWRDAGGVEV